MIKTEKGSNERKENYTYICTHIIHKTKLESTIIFQIKKIIQINRKNSGSKKFLTA